MIARAIKIDGKQLVMLLTVFRVFDLLTYSPEMGKGENGATVLLAYPLSLAMLAIVMLPAWILLARFSGNDIMDCAYRLSKPLGVVCSVLFCLLFVLIAGDTVGNFEYLMTAAVYPQASPVFFIFTMGLVCAYAAYLGLEPVARFNTFLFFALVGTVVFLTIAVLPKAETVYLHGPFYAGAGAFFRQTVQMCFGNFDVLAWLLLVPYTRGHVAKSFVGWLFTTAMLGCTLIFLVTTGLGDYAATQSFPFLSLCSVAELSIFQRLDNLHLTLWTFLAFCKTAVLIFLAAQSLRHILPQRLEKLAPAFCAVGTALCAYGISARTKTLVLAGSILQSGVLVAIFAVMLPFVLLVWAIAAKKKGYVT